jgi:hypothetical protein
MEQTQQIEQILHQRLQKAQKELFQLGVAQDGSFFDFVIHAFATPARLIKNCEYEYGIYFSVHDKNGRALDTVGIDYDTDLEDNWDEYWHDYRNLDCKTGKRIDPED